MNRINVFIIALVSFSLFFTNCKKPPEEVPPDVTAPVIKFPNNDTLYLELGDKSGALKGVTALDDVDGTLTSSIKITNDPDFNSVGYIQIEYTVSDAAKNVATKTRDVVVKSGKLAGNYEVKAGFNEEGGSFLPEFIIEVSEQNNSELSVKNFHRFDGDNPVWRGGWTITLVGGGNKKLKIVELEKLKNPISTDGEYKLTGEIMFDIVNGEYQLVSMLYTLSPMLSGYGQVEEEYIATCKKKQ